MKERPILFSAPMVRAILEDRKTQTRQIVKPQPIYAGGAWKCADGSTHQATRPSKTLLSSCPYGQPGDRLWVRETHAPGADQWGAWARRMDEDGSGPDPVVYYAADGGERPFIERWRPSIHMPRWASRIDLEVTGVRVERLQDISEADAIAEGLDHVADGAAAFGIRGLATSWDNDPRVAYRRLWESINGPGSWDANPWVWGVEFRRVKP